MTSKSKKGCRKSDGLESNISELGPLKSEDFRDNLIRCIENRKEQKIFRSAVGSLNWFAGCTMPQLSFDVMTLSMKFGKATVRDLKYLTRLVKRAKAQNCSILIPRMQEKK